MKADISELAKRFGWWWREDNELFAFEPKKTSPGSSVPTAQRGEKF